MGRPHRRRYDPWYAGQWWRECKTEQPQVVELAGDADPDWVGIAIGDQLRLVDGATYDTSRPLSYVTGGRGRCYAETALAADIFYCSSANARARAWVNGVDDGLAMIGRTLSACTAAGELVDVTVERE